MPGKNKQPQIPPSKSWGTHVKSAILHVIAVAQYALTCGRSWGADGTIFCEAEEFTVEKPGWQTRPWGENYYAATFANTILSRKAFLGAPEQCDETVATIRINVQKAGRYLVLVRYEAVYRFETQFRVKVEQAGRVRLDRLYGARDNLKIWAFGKRLRKEMAWSWENVVLEGHDAYADLKPGPATITLLAGPLARLQAATGRAVTTQLHDRVEFDGTHRLLLSLLDGTRDHRDLANQLTRQTLQGDLKLEKAGDPVEDSTRIRELIASEIAPCLQRLAKSALLIG
jgi:hypothetical protein